MITNSKICSSRSLIVVQAITYSTCLTLEGEKMKSASAFLCLFCLFGLLSVISGQEEHCNLPDEEKVDCAPTEDACSAAECCWEPVLKR